MAEKFEAGREWEATDRDTIGCYSAVSPERP